MKNEDVSTWLIGPRSECWFVWVWLWEWDTERKMTVGQRNISVVRLQRSVRGCWRWPAEDLKCSDCDSGQFSCFSLLWKQFLSLLNVGEPPSQTNDRNLLIKTNTIILVLTQQPSAADFSWSRGWCRRSCRVWIQTDIGHLWQILVVEVVTMEGQVATEDSGVTDVG